MSRDTEKYHFWKGGDNKYRFQTKIKIIWQFRRINIINQHIISVSDQLRQKVYRVLADPNSKTLLLALGKVIPLTFRSFNFSYAVHLPRWYTFHILWLPWKRRRIVCTGTRRYILVEGATFSFFEGDCEKQNQLSKQKKTPDKACTKYIATYF
jgi:hypothetical protein